MRPPRLVLLVDGGPAAGWGHVGRCFALAQAWADEGGHATFACHELDGHWRARCDAEGFDVVAPEDAAYGGADWAVVDGYDLPPAELRSIEDSGIPVLQVDDHGLSRPVPARVIVDQNLGAEEATYATRGAAQLLLGPRYALLRRELRCPARTDRSREGEARRLLVSLGGSPTEAARETFEQTLADPRLARLEVIELAGRQDVAAAMAQADLALAASGSTSWELCATGVPAVLVAMAANQVPLARGLAAHGAALDGGPIEAVDASLLAALVANLAGDHARRQRMAAAGRDLVDGRGALRVVAAMRAS